MENNSAKYSVLFEVDMLRQKMVVKMPYSKYSLYVAIFLFCLLFSCEDVQSVASKSRDVSIKTLTLNVAGNLYTSTFDDQGEIVVELPFDTDLAAITTLPIAMLTLAEGATAPSVVGESLTFNNQREAFITVLSEDGSRLKRHKIQLVLLLMLRAGIYDMNVVFDDLYEDTLYVSEVPSTVIIKGLSGNNQVSMNLLPNNVAAVANDRVIIMVTTKDNLTQTYTVVLIKAMITYDGAAKVVTGLDANYTSSPPQDNFHVVIPAVVDGLAIDSIGHRAFAYDLPCKMTSAVVGEGISRIGVESFSDCSTITQVTISSSIVSIGTRAFFHCEKLTVVLYGVTPATLGEGVFDGIVAIKVPASLVETYQTAWGGYASLISAQ